MKVTHMFLGAAERERALRYSGQGVPEDEDPSDEEEPEGDGRFPITGSPSKLGGARGHDDDEDDRSDDEERAWLEEVNR